MQIERSSGEERSTSQKEHQIQHRGNDSRGNQPQNTLNALYTLSHLDQRSAGENENEARQKCIERSIQKPNGTHEQGTMKVVEACHESNKRHHDDERAWRCFGEREPVQHLRLIEPVMLDHSYVR